MVNINYIKSKERELDNLIKEAIAEGVCDDKGNQVKVAHISSYVTISSPAIELHRCVCCEDLHTDTVKIGNGYICSRCNVVAV